MKSEKFYDDWMKQRNQIEIGENFTQDVMGQIYQYEQRRKRPLFNMEWFFEFVSANSLAKLGLVTAGVIAGLIRMAFTAYVSLGI